MINYYVKTNAEDHILLQSSDLVLFPHEIASDGWSPVNPHIEGEYFRDGVPLYILIDGAPVRRAEADIQADIDALPETPDINAFVLGVMEEFADE